MAYNETLASRVREILSKRRGVTEKKIFGGLTFLLNDNMCCGIVGDDLVVRVGADNEPGALAAPHARAMDFTGRPLKGMIYVNADGTEDDTDLAVWIDLATEFVSTLPAKQQDGES